MQRTAAPLFSQTVATMMKRRRISMMSSIVLKVKIMVMKEGALVGTLARPALRRTAAMVFNRSSEIKSYYNLPIGTFLVLSLLTINFHWEDGCIFQRLQTYDNSILPKFSLPSSLMAIRIYIHKASDV